MTAPAPLKPLSSEKGVALVAALLLLVLTSAVAVALLMTVNTEQNLQRTDQGNNQAYYAAEAGMENMMKDLYNLYTQFQSPTVAQIQALQANVPTQVPNATYPEYIFNVPNTGGIPNSRQQTISSGPNQGLIALITPMTLQVTADMPGQQEVRLIRSVEVSEIPVFQFGVFSGPDLAFYPGPNFDIGGRVHTNGNLFVSADGGTLTFHDKVRAVGDVVRDTMQNGASIAAQGRTTTVRFPTAPSGCDGALPACRNMLYTSPDEGSSFGGPTPANGGTGTYNNSWSTISLNPPPAGYNSMVLNGKTGATTLTLPFVSGGLQPIEIVRQPLAGDTQAMASSRMYNKAEIRVLLTDNPAELPGGAADPQNIRLANWKPAVGPDYSSGVPVVGVGGGNVFFAEGLTGNARHTHWTAVPAAEPTLVPAGAPATSPTTWNLIDGYLRVEILSGGAYIPVTQEWLQLGFGRNPLPPTQATPNPVNPNAILLLQEEADENANNAVDAGASPLEVTNTVTTWMRGAGTKNNWFPINFYDAREGEIRENQRVTTNCSIGGVMNAVEIDVGNLSKWLLGTIPGSGNLVDFTSQNGYVLYFSDHRGMLTEPHPSPYTGLKHGPSGLEDSLNWNTATGTNFGTLEQGEDVNGDGFLDNYGEANLGLGFGVAQPGNHPTFPVSCMNMARENRVSGARRVLRLVDGALGQVPVRPDGNGGGFTVASDNPVYVLGNYNANNAGFGNPHASAAVIADTVTLLSNGWTDLESFNSPATVAGRGATTTYYRLAIASGKTIAFPFYPTPNTPLWAGGPSDFGTDGGVHNFLRYLENWGGQTAFYMGSMVSLYYDQYATGSFKCCGTVYSPPTRNYQFDTDFQNPAKMPPGTPMFEDLVNVGFQQVF